MKSNYLDKNILLVDDMRTNLLTLQAMLEDKGYTSVSSVISAKDMFSLLDTQPIDLILLDVGMPDIDGIEACITLRASSIHKHISIIMVTGDDSDEVLEKSFDAGADDFATKPINFINLHSRIQSVLALKEKDQLILNQTRYAAMNDIIESISDQWREPLAHISELALNIDILHKSGKLTRQKMETSLNNISTYAIDLSQTIDDFKKVSVVEKKPKNADINKLLVYTIKMIQNVYSKKSIKIQFQEQVDIKKINIYPNELIRVLLNLFVNSQEAFDKQDTNQKKIVQIIISQNNFDTSISIKDNAGGIDKKELLNIFNPYSSTKKESGKGLGLYSCKKVIEEHMTGKLKAYSKNNTTEFIISLTSLEDDIEPEELKTGVFSTETPIKEEEPLEETTTPTKEEDNTKNEKEEEKEKDNEIYDDTDKLATEDMQEGIDLTEKEVPDIENLDVEKENERQ